MKKILITIALLLIASLAIPDEITIPFAFFPKEVQEAFAREGLKLDLNGNDRTKDSWGFIVSKGTEIILYTYKTMTKEDFEMLDKIFYGK